MRSNGRGKNALRAVDAQFGEMKRTLLELARIPGVSAPGFPAEEVRRSAQAFADVLRQVGIENVRILEVPGVHPYVYGEWLKREGRTNGPALRPPRRRPAGAGRPLGVSAV